MPLGLGLAMGRSLPTAAGGLAAVDEFGTRTAPAAAKPAPITAGITVVDSSLNLMELTIRSPHSNLMTAGALIERLLDCSLHRVPKPMNSSHSIVFTWL